MRVASLASLRGGIGVIRLQSSFHLDPDKNGGGELFGITMSWQRHVVASDHSSTHRNTVAPPRSPNKLGLRNNTSEPRFLLTCTM